MLFNKLVMPRLERRALGKALANRLATRKHFEEREALLEEEFPMEEPETIFGAMNNALLVTIGAVVSNIVFPNGLFIHMESRFEGLFWEGLWLTACNIGVFFLAFALGYFGFSLYLDAVKKRKRERRLSALHAARDKLLDEQKEPHIAEEDIEEARKQYDRMLCRLRAHPEQVETISKVVLEWCLEAIREALPMEGDTLEAEVSFMLQNGALHCIGKDEINEEEGLGFYSKMEKLQIIETQHLYQSYRDEIAEYSAAVAAVYESVEAALRAQLEDQFDVTLDIHEEHHTTVFTIHVGLIEKAGEKGE